MNPVLGMISSAALVATFVLMAARIIYVEFAGMRRCGQSAVFGEAMKLRCNDGVVRSFAPAIPTGTLCHDGKYTTQPAEAQCLDCGYQFGVHDTWILKPKFKTHICKEIDDGNKTT